MCPFIRTSLRSNNPENQEGGLIDLTFLLLAHFFLSVLLQREKYFYFETFFIYFYLLALQVYQIYHEMDEDQLLDYDEEQTEVQVEAPAGENGANGDATKLKVSYFFVNKSDEIL